MFIICKMLWIFLYIALDRIKVYLSISEWVRRSLFTRAKEGERDKRVGAQEKERERERMRVCGWVLLTWLDHIRFGTNSCDLLTCSSMINSLFTDTLVQKFKCIVLQNYWTQMVIHARAQNWMYCNVHINPYLNKRPWMKMYHLFQREQAHANSSYSSTASVNGWFTNLHIKNLHLNIMTPNILLRQRHLNVVLVYVQPSCKL